MSAAQTEQTAPQPLVDPARAPPVLHVVRVTIEAVTPLSTSSGEALAFHDNALARDANGLPLLMSTALAGVLRHVHADYFGENKTRELFGFEESRKQTGQASHIEVSFGFVHDEHDQPVAGRLMPAAIEADPILRHLASPAPVRRDHVKLDAKHVAAEHLKFERISIPAGTRFSLELLLEGEAEDAHNDKVTLARRDPRSG